MKKNLLAILVLIPICFPTYPTMGGSETLPLAGYRNPAATPVHITRKKRRDEMKRKIRNGAKVLKQFRGYLKAAIYANNIVLEEALECVATLEKLKSSECKSFHDHIVNEIIPAHRKMRLYAALVESQKASGMANPEFTEHPSVYQSYRAKINPDRDEHIFFEFADFSPFGVSDDLEPDDIQPLSAEEIIAALKIFKQDGERHREDFNKRTNIMELELKLSELENASAEQFRDEAEFLRMTIQQIERRRPRNVNLMRIQDREAYKKKYFEALQESPVVAFIKMPEVKVKDSRAHAKQVLCQENELAYDRSIAFKTDHLFFDNTCTIKKIPDVYIVNELAKRPVYKTDLASLLPSIREGLSVVHRMSQQTLATPFDESGDNFNDLLNLVRYDELFKTFRQDMESKENQGLTQTLDFIQSHYDSKVNIESFGEMAGSVALGVGCALVIRRFPGVKSLIAAGARLVGWATAASIASCTLISGLGVNIFFFSSSNNRYFRTFRHFFSSLGELEVSSQLPADIEQELEEGETLKSHVLYSIDKLNERDLDMGFELVFFGIGTGIGEAIRAVRPLLKGSASRLKDVIKGVK